jgi:hypothetical protein
MLTIAGLVLALWFVQMLQAPGPAPLHVFIVAVIAVAMISVGVRYILKSPRKKKPQGEPGK